MHTTHTPYMLHSFNLHPPVIAPRMVNYGTSDPPSTLHESPSESVTPQGKLTPHNNPLNLVLNIPSDPYSDPSSSYSSLLNPSDLLDGDYFK